ncbi:MAG: MFS transporter [Chloroflexi bacterium]|nr:MFS transporter [Chloroflexota bacterium]
MQREVTFAGICGFIATIILAFLILIGSRNLAHFDAALVAYTASILFATFGLTYRYTMWLQRPPTALYWKRGWQVFLNRKYLRKNTINWFRHVTEDMALNRFIFERSRMRGITHFLIMWGCIIAISITFPLVFGWLHFESVPGEIDTYKAYVFGFPTFTFPSGSIFGFLIFHGLVWSALVTLSGVMLAMRRRMREEGAAALQLFVEDFLPLILLFAVCITGLMLTASYTWLKGYAYDFIAILHAIMVIITFLWLPFGKFFHIFQRPAQIGVRFYKYVGEREEPAVCRRCNTPFTSLMHVQDLIITEKQLGYNYEIPGTSVEHYQWICPRCRRAMLALAQGQLWQKQLGGESSVSISYTPSTPSYVNPGMGEGPLGHEDAKNFHP